MSAFERLFGPTEPFAAAGAARPDTEAIDVLLEATDSEPPSAHPADHDRVDSAAPDWSMSEATAGVLAEPPAQSTSSVLSRDGTLAFDTVILAVTGLALLAWALANLATGASAKVTVLGVVAANLAFAAALLRRSSAA
jgi:hypothetical protein